MFLNSVGVQSIPASNVKSELYSQDANEWSLASMLVRFATSRAWFRQDAATHDSTRETPVNNLRDIPEVRNVPDL